MKKILLIFYMLALAFLYLCMYRVLYDYEQAKCKLVNELVQDGIFEKKEDIYEALISGENYSDEYLYMAWVEPNSLFSLYTTGMSPFILAKLYVGDGELPVKDFFNISWNDHTHLGVDRHAADVGMATVFSMCHTLFSIITATLIVGIFIFYLCRAKVATVTLFCLINVVVIYWGFKSYLGSPFGAGSFRQSLSNNESIQLTYDKAMSILAETGETAIFKTETFPHYSGEVFVGKAPVFDAPFCRLKLSDYQYIYFLENESDFGKFRRMLDATATEHGVGTNALVRMVQYPVYHVLLSEFSIHVIDGVAGWLLLYFVLFPAKSLFEWVRRLRRASNTNTIPKEAK